MQTNISSQDTNYRRHDDADELDDNGDITDEELVASTPNQRNWKGILIALLVVGCVISLIVLSVFLVSPVDDGPGFSGTRFTLKDLMGESFKPVSFSGHWVSDKEIAYRDETNGISLLDIDTLASRRLLSNFTFRRMGIKEFWVSSLKQYILIRHEAKKNAMDSFHFVSEYTAMKMSTEESRRVTPFPTKEFQVDRLQYAQWIPNSESIAMVYKNDIYILASPVAQSVTRLTNTGIPGVIFNGVTDILYQDYVLHQTNAVWLSPDGKRLCYASFNSSMVRSAGIPTYSEDYTSVQTIRYPKVDTVNPEVTLWVINLDSLKSEGSTEAKQIKPPKRFQDMEHYITDTKWIDRTAISIVWRNRDQNISVSTLCNSKTLLCQEVLTELAGYKKWAITEKVPVYDYELNAYVSVFPLADGSVGTYNHIHQGHVNSRHNVPLTYGHYTVFSVVVWDTYMNYVYYLANTPDDPAARHLYRVTDINSIVPRIQQCITCNLNISERPCKHYSPILQAENIEHIILHCEGPSVPFTILFSLNNTEVIATIQNNTELLELNATMAWPQVQNFRLKLEDDFIANVRMLLPPELNAEEIYSHPTIIAASGVPGEQTVNHKWGATYNTYLASNKSWIVVSMDIRGSGASEIGKAYTPSWIMGTKESLDHRSIVRHLIDRYNLVDAQRIGVWGWGHKGYTALRMLADDSNKLISCTAAINAVTDWKRYASFYSEKYMGTSRVIPGGNYRGYEESTLRNRAKDFTNRSLYIIHGSADTNVFFSHFLKFSKELINKGVLFRQQIYTDEDHSLSGVLMHLYRSLEEYFESCFLPYSKEESESIFGG